MDDGVVDPICAFVEDMLASAPVRARVSTCSLTSRLTCCGGQLVDADDEPDVAHTRTCLAALGAALDVSLDTSNHQALYSLASWATYAAFDRANTEAECRAFGLDPTALPPVLLLQRSLALNRSAVELEVWLPRALRQTLLRQPAWDATADTPTPLRFFTPQWRQENILVVPLVSADGGLAEVKGCPLMRGDHIRRPWLFPPTFTRPPPPLPDRG